MSQLQTQIYASVDAKETGAPSVGSAVANLKLSSSFALSSGTGAGHADLCYVAARSIAASSSETLDLNGVLQDVFGGTINAAKIKSILILPNVANTGDLVVGAAAANPFLGPFGATGTVNVRPGGIMLLADQGDGWLVTPTTADQLKIANASSAVANYQISIVAASA